MTTDQRKLLDLERRIRELEAFLTERMKTRSREQELINLGKEMRTNPEKYAKKGAER